MHQHQSLKPLSESEILSVFDALGLATQEQRDSVLARTEVMTFDKLSKYRAITWLSDSSEPVAHEEIKYAKLEDTIR